MTGQAIARVNGATMDVGPAIGSAWQPARSGQPRPMDAGVFTLVSLPTSPFWARRYTRSFLRSCRGTTKSTARNSRTARFGTRHQCGAVLRVSRKVFCAGHEGLLRPRMLRSRAVSYLIRRMVAAIFV
jgi:hypothetical protein